MKTESAGAAQDCCSPEHDEVRNSFGGIVEHLGPARQVIAKHDDRVLERIVVAAKAFMRSQTQSAVQDAGRRSIIMICSGDLTPMVLRCRETIVLPTGPVSREGMQPCEWLHTGGDHHRVTFDGRDASGEGKVEGHACSSEGSFRDI